MPLDLETIFFAVVAILILWRLWSVLGARSEDEPQRPNPFTAPPPAPPSVDAPFSAAPAPALSPPTFPPTSLAGGLAQIKAADPAFDERAFLQQARASFTAIVEAYASGMLDGVAPLLSPALLAHFQQAVDARRSAGQSAQTRILSIDDAETKAAHAEGAQCFITVMFISTQENILRDASGAVIGGGEGSAEKVNDVWIFGHDAQTPDGKWIVIETRG